MLDRALRMVGKVTSVHFQKLVSGAGWAMHCCHIGSGESEFLVHWSLGLELQPLKNNLFKLFVLKFF